MRLPFAHGLDSTAEATRGLSPCLHFHFGHASTHQILAAIAAHEGWSVADLPRVPRGGTRDWYGMGAGAEAFLDQVVSWRELGFRAPRPDHADFESPQAWARRTLEEHAADRREPVHALEDLTAARTADPVWNAARTHPPREGLLPGCLRMLRGRKILEWSASPRQALVAMSESNDRFALDGRGPDPHAGIFPGPGPP